MDKQKHSVNPGVVVALVGVVFLAIAITLAIITVSTEESEPIIEETPPTGLDIDKTVLRIDRAGHNYDIIIKQNDSGDYIVTSNEQVVCVQAPCNPIKRTNTYSSNSPLYIYIKALVNKYEASGSVDYSKMNYREKRYLTSILQQSVASIDQYMIAFTGDIAGSATEYNYVRIIVTDTSITVEKRSGARPEKAQINFNEKHAQMVRDFVHDVCDEHNDYNVSDLKTDSLTDEQMLILQALLDNDESLLDE